jgi:flagellar M-ring protein FliF
MTAELDRLKVPYQLGDADEAHGGAAGTILVDRKDVYRTRIKLMGKDIPLRGAVGFELFNNSDLGMTEFAQKVNYQRALQGELTRTILSLAEIRDARVLLAMPEQGLFKQASHKPKASVTLTLKRGQELRAEQVGGIQRLVSAAVPGIQPQDVTIVDQSGVALTRPGGDAAEGEGSTGLARLDIKKDTENYLSRKATAVIERALGPGQGSASVDVTLDMNRVQTNTDEVIGVPGRAGGPPVGIVSRERDSSRETGNAGPAPASAGSPSGGAVGASNQHEVEYALGHRVEQVISQPGSVRRIQVAVVTRRSLPPAQQEQLRQMVAAAVGASSERGDAVVVQGAGDFGTLAKGGAAPDAADAAAALTHGEPAGLAAGGAPRGGSTHAGLWAGAGVLVVAALVAWLLGSLRRPAAPAGLTPAQREETLRRLRTWLAEAPQDAAPHVNGGPR